MPCWWPMSFGQLLLLVLLCGQWSNMFKTHLLVFFFWKHSQFETYVGILIWTFLCRLLFVYCYDNNFQLILIGIWKKMWPRNESRQQMKFICNKQFGSKRNSNNSDKVVSSFLLRVSLWNSNCIKFAAILSRTKNEMWAGVSGLLRT